MFVKLKDSLRPVGRMAKRFFLDDRDWRKRKYEAPSPKKVKDEVLMRNSVPNGVWVETGTFLGETTRLLAKLGRHVYTLEPASSLFERARSKFSAYTNVTVINAPSEAAFPDLLPTLEGPTNFWLDGHFSAGQTYQGIEDTPIKFELQIIEENLEKLKPVSVLVDDVRCFDPSVKHYEGYPELDYLVDWARKNGLFWHIEHDIFVARSR